MDWKTVTYYLSTVLLGAIYFQFLREHIHNKVQKSYIQMYEIVSMTIVSALMTLIPISYFCCKEYNLEVPNYIGIIGVLLIVLSIAILELSYLSLGRQYSPTLQIRENHKLITTGIYAYVRHPMYLAGLIMFFSYLCLSPNVVGIAAYVCAMALIYKFRIPYEEKMLVNVFGQEYIDYMNKTPRFGI